MNAVKEIRHGLQLEVQQPAHTTCDTDFHISAQLRSFMQCCEVCHACFPCCVLEGREAAMPIFFADLHTCCATLSIRGEPQASSINIEKHMPLLITHTQHSACHCSQRPHCSHTTFYVFLTHNHSTHCSHTTHCSPRIAHTQHYMHYALRFWILSCLQPNEHAPVRACNPISKEL